MSPGESKRIAYQPHQDLQLFFNLHKPSEIDKPDIFWVCIDDPSSKVPEVDEQTAHVLWSRLQKETDDIHLDHIEEIARSANFTRGKWYLTAKSDTVDDLWSLVASSTLKGELGVSAEASTKTSASNVSGKKHKICIHTKDFTDTDDVMRVERKLRSLGLKGQLIYKPDIFNEFGVYFRNEWKLPHELHLTNRN